jgi:hypothetical protein
MPGIVEPAEKDERCVPNAPDDADQQVGPPPAEGPDFGKQQSAPTQFLTEREQGVDADAGQQGTADEDRNQQAVWRQPDGRRRQSRVQPSEVLDHGRPVNVEMSDTRHLADVP